MWTEQTVETLKKLALEGRSAAWIAAAIGAPSRSAVIGKANRIGVKLSGAPTRSEPLPDRQRMTAGWTFPRPNEARPEPRRRSDASGRAAALARGRYPVGYTEKRRDRWLFAVPEVGEMRRLPLADIGDAECRWPLGDPTQEDFAFCGLQALKGHAYCAGHCRMVYRRPSA
jgi:GcrA cell cycle regulator